MIDRVFDLWGVYDNNEKVICLVRNTDAKDLCDLLNELHEENEQLKYNLYDHMVDLNNSTGKCSALEIENEQLNQQIKELKAYNNWLISVLEDSGAIVEIKKR